MRGGHPPRWLLPVVKFILPRPDLVIYLANSPEEVHRRKPELTVEQIAEQNRKCREIVQNMSYAMTVSTEQSPGEVARVIADRIVKIMKKRLEGELQ